MVRLAAFTVIAFSAALALGSAPARAQSDEMTAEEITEAFEKQKTRGLVIVPSDGQDSGAASASVAPALDEAGYSAVDKADQVNIQIAFDFDSAALRPDQKPKLATLCEVMKSVDVKLFQIIGHTDSSGSAAYNQRLSLLRAQEVKRHLVGECGIAETRLEAIGMGERAPYDSDDPRADVNRRVEFQALG